MRFTVGTYTRGTDAAGIYTLETDRSFETTRIVSVNRDIENPSWQLFDRERQMLYSVSEVADDGEGGVCALRYDDGVLELVARVSSLGADPCHLALAGDHLYVSNYGGGNLITWGLDGDGVPVDMQSLVAHRGSSIDPVRQKSPHVHSSLVHEPSATLLVCDLGLDRLYRYPLTAAGIDVSGRKALAMRPGAGPRLMAQTPDGRYGFLVCELDNTVLTVDLDGEAMLELCRLSTLPDECEEPSYCGHVAVDATGRHLYVSNRGHDSIAVFGIGEDGQLERLQHVPAGGRHPRFFCLTPGEEHLLVANRDSDSINVLARNPQDGTLEETGRALSVPAPVCITPLD